MFQICQLESFVIIQKCDTKIVFKISKNFISKSTIRENFWNDLGIAFHFARPRWITLKQTKLAQSAKSFGHKLHWCVDKLDEFCFKRKFSTNG